MEKRELFPITKGPDENERLTENAVMVETPYMKVRILYGMHSAERRVKEKEFGDADALALELYEDYSTPEKAIVAFSAVMDIIRYRKIIEKIKEQKKPAFFLDISNADLVLTLQLGLKGVEGAAGFLLLISALNSLSREEPMTRREFFRETAKDLTGVYFSTQFLESLMSLLQRGKVIDERSKRRMIHRFFLDLNQRIHPETEIILHTLRNDVIAQKLTTIAQTQFPNLARKPDIALTIGAGHIGIEHSFQKESEGRVELIRKLLRIPGLEEARKRVAAIARIDYEGEEDNKTKWNVKIFKDPHLAPLEKERELKRPAYEEGKATFTIER